MIDDLMDIEGGSNTILEIVVGPIQPYKTSLCGDDYPYFLTHCDTISYPMWTI